METSRRVFAAALRRINEARVREFAKGDGSRQPTRPGRAVD